MRAYYTADRKKFYSDTKDHIIGELAQHHNFDLLQDQTGAWQEQIDLLREILEVIPKFTLFLEFHIPRIGKRVDAIIVVSGILFVIEFKSKATFDRADIEQVEDYALDLKNFHLGSHKLLIYPILIPFKAKKSRIIHAELAFDQVTQPLLLSRFDAGEVILQLSSQFIAEKFDPLAWSVSGYRPTPTIIEAARALYEGHDVLDIARSDAGALNLTATQETIARVIDISRRNGEKSVCFVTGVPGAGKTLAGLNIATMRSDFDKSEHATFLSGNGPLVNVLREALARDIHRRKKGLKKSDAKSRVNAFIQNIHKFRDAYANNTDIPSDHVVVFDEAQRAWTTEQASKFMRDKRKIADFNMSEPEFLLSVLDRHPDWCTVICLIGGGQEINTGEAGLSEWMSAVKNKFPHWQVYASDHIIEPDYDLNNVGKDFLRRNSVKLESSLHLNVSMRSFRAESLSMFVSNLLNNDVDKALFEYEKIKESYPIVITRDLQLARDWLCNKARGTERFGLIASSGAKRLRPHGLNLSVGIKPENWFLNDRNDVRSSFYLEEVASEFDVQGLELDWACVCWDANFRYLDEDWRYFEFKGTKWHNVHMKIKKTYLRNAYRVLLTRARQGMVIYIPNGDSCDYTRMPKFYDQTYHHLKQCGLVDLTDSLLSQPPNPPRQGPSDWLMG